MHILLSNDDGYLAPGIICLAHALQGLGEITVVAPERNRSGASNSLTLDRPVSLKQAENGFFYVNGTPTDCVHLAVTGMLEKLPDIVVSGINQGPNMGDDTLYSGTVAAATEAYLLGIPALAISLAGYDSRNFSSAGKIARQLVERFIASPPSEATLLNVNVPDVAYEELSGFKATRLGKRHKAESVIKIVSPRHETMYWVGAAGPAQDAGEGTDFHAVTENFVSVTPLQIDLTHQQQLHSIRSWLA
ncbi:MAG: 5'/3'-nucleotidase SurE [Zoogloeaceae bacterium]|nr:5'/3'-nucleotidase SurE [Zoogloeaceae bacterium]